MEPSDDISFMLFLGYKDYPTDDNYVAKTQIPLKNSTEGKTKSMVSVMEKPGRVSSYCIIL